nr:hypothetical protein [Tanacetum cinerariifolium]
MSWDKFQKKFTNSSLVIQQRDAEIVALKAKLETTKKVSLEVSGLHGRVSALEAEVVDAVARHFKEQSAKLDARIADVRCNIDTGLYPHTLTAIAGRRWVLGHGICLAVMKCGQSSKCRSALGKVISFAINKGILQGLEVGIEHEKARRSLAHPEAENKYVATIGEFKNVSFSFMEESEALKDSPLALIMYALTLEGDADCTPKLRSSSIRHEMLLSNAIPAIRGHAERRGLGSSSSSVMGRVLSHDDLFDITVLDKPIDT